MNRAQLIAAATVLLGSVGGAVLFLNAGDTTDMSGTIGATGMLEVLDKSQCSVAACGAPACMSAQNDLNDAGLPCTVGFVDCSIRVGQRARDIGADAGFIFGPQKYQRMRLVGMRCPAQGGGFAYDIPTTDAGWPLYMVSTTTPRCARAPLDGGTACLRDDGSGPRFFGTGNVFPAAQAAGANCDQVECTVLYGDNPDTSL